MLSYSNRVTFNTTSADLNGVTTTDVRRFSMDVVWNSVSEWANSTKVQWRKVGTGTWTGSGELGKNRVAYTIDNLDRSTQYEIRVSAAGGGETREATITRTTADFVKPSAPTFTNITGNSITISWTHSDPAGEAGDGFAIFRDGKKVGEVGAKIRKFVDTGLKAGVTYSYFIRAKYSLANIDGPVATQRTASGSNKGAIVTNATVSNGYIANAMVFLDANFNSSLDFFDLDGDGLQDDGEPSEPFAVTNEIGEVTLVIPEEFDINQDGVIDSAEGTYVARGGVDVVTMQPVESVLAAPGGSSVITPLTTLVSEVMSRHALGIVDALAMVREHFTLPNVDITQYELIQAMIEEDTFAVGAYTTLAKVHDTAVQIGQLLHGATGTGLVTAINAGFAALADDVVINGGSGSLTEYQGLLELIRTAAHGMDATLNDESISAAATVIAAGNESLNQIASETSEAFLIDVKRLQSVALGDAANSLASLGAGKATASDVVSQFTGSSLGSHIDSATVAAIVPPHFDVAVNENVAGGLVGEFVIPGGIGSFYTLDVSDERFEILSGQLRLKPDVYLDKSHESEVHVTVITVGDHPVPGGVQGFSISVAANPVPWSNPLESMDVNADKTIAPGDALVIINFLNANGSQLLPKAIPAGSPYYYDTNADSWITPNDALRVINRLNELSQGSSAEAESSADVPTPELQLGIGPMPVLLPTDSPPRRRTMATEEPSTAFASVDLRPIETVFDDGKPTGPDWQSDRTVPHGASVFNDIMDDIAEELLPCDEEVLRLITSDATSN